MNLAHNLGLELPILPPETPGAWTSHEIFKATQGGESRFTRRMAFEFPRKHTCDSLGRALEIADEVIEEAAENLGVKAIKRTWGLYKDPGNLSKEQQRKILKSKLIPEGYFLVAEVPVVSPAHRLTETQVETLTPKLSSYYLRSKATHILRPWIASMRVWGIC